ncbi:MAG: hypothetical protein IPG44_10365 [Anaerolineales bacterium]|jgi:hypothetical protein|nr:hypothetical protein [Chloroflexota bacterium]MBK6646134.1 hypothetical protein [Anaerolineales bacterium]
MNRNQLFWGAALLLVGGLMLAGEMGVRLPNGNSLMSLFWPLLLIGLGGWVIASVFFRGTHETESARIDTQGAHEALVRIDHGAGEFRLHSGSSGNDLLNGTFAGGLESNVSRNGDRLEVRLRPANDFFPLPPFGFHNQRDWDVSFNPSIPSRLDMNMGANKSVIDLSDLTITDIKLKSGASETTMTLPARGRLTADFEIGAASLTIIVPEGVAVRASAAMGAGDFSMDRTRFPSKESPDFASAVNAVDIHVRGGAASVRVR